MYPYHCSQHTRVPFGLLLVLLLLAASPVSASAPDQPDFPPAIVRCDPSYAEGYTDGKITVDLYLEDTQNTYGIDTHVSFDTTIARVEDKNPSAPGTQIEPVYTWFNPSLFLLNVACHAGDPVALQCSTPADIGIISFAATQFNPTPPVNGSGPFARVTFLPLKFGTFTMHFTYHKLSGPTGEQVPSIAQDCTIKFISPLAVDLATFTAEPGQASIVLRWETVSEEHHAGFNLLRGDSAAGPWQQVNNTFIPAAAPGAGTGHAYTWEDQSVEPGHKYFYVLEDVTLQGAVTRHDPVEVIAQTPNAVVLSSFVGYNEQVIFPALLAVLGFLFIAVRFTALRRMRG